MKEELLQIKEHTGENYLPLVRFGAWRVAILNYHSRFRRENLTQLERHVLTDETFTLLKGRAILYVGDGDADHAGTVEAVPLHRNRIYNVRKGVWHAIEVSRDASVIITENEDTSPANSPKLAIDPGQLPPMPPLNDSADPETDGADAQMERYEELDALIRMMNEEAVKSDGIPYIRPHEYAHYRDIRDFLHDYTRKLLLPEEERRSLTRFCFRDTLEMKNRMGNRDLSTVTFHYFKSMVYRTGNLDTPDDCTEKLDMDLFGPYRAAREKQWRNEELSPAESEILRNTEAKIARETEKP